MKIAFPSTTALLLLLFSSVLAWKDKPKEVQPGQLKKGSAETKNCNGNKCEIDTTGIDLASDEEIELVGLGPNSKTIKCSKKAHPGKGKGKAKAWFGQCDGNAQDLVLVERPSGKLTASVHVDGASCIIHDDNTVECLLLSEFPDEEQLESGGRERQLVMNEVNDYIAGFVPKQEAMHALRGGTNSNRHLIDENGSTIDIMVVWTREAECRYTGKGSGPNCGLDEISEESFAGLVDLLVAQTNAAFDSSGVNIAIRLVHAYRHPDYVEPDSSITAIYSLRNNGDGDLDDVHAKRTLYGADLVHMIIGSTGCGVAFPGPNKSYAFSITRYTCAVNQYSFTHEVGHMLGTMHDRGTEDTCGQTVPFNYGWRDPVGEFRTVMAYRCAAQCDGVVVNPGFYCGRVLLFSSSDNTNVYYEGQSSNKQTGNVENDNARAMNENRIDAAGFYPAMDCDSDTECNDHDSSTIDTCDTENGVCVFVSTLTSAPVTLQPTPTPATSAPIYYQEASMEALVVSGLGDSWLVVQLIETYTSAVPVCSLEMDLGTAMDPAVIRIQNIGTSSFEIKLQSAVSAEAVIQMVRDVHCVVVEEGAWQLPDGRLIEAQKLMSTVTANKSNWSAVQSVSYLNSYSSTPVVLGQVISTNDARWSVFMAHGGGDRTTRPTTTELKVGKLTAGDFSERSDEMLGVIVVAAGHAFSGSTEIETARSQNVARGYVEGLRGHLFQQEFGIEPAVMVVSQVGYIGGDGSWAVTQGLPLADHFRPALDEDMFEDAERVHTSETMDYMVLTVAGSLTLTATVGSTGAPPTVNLPSASPTDSPTSSPVDFPTSSPLNLPSASPTDSPTSSPVDFPTSSPLNLPSASPTDSPTSSPVDFPTSSPLNFPSASPTDSPTSSPVDFPTSSPLNLPSASPTDSPTSSPVDSPTAPPVDTPSSPMMEALVVSGLGDSWVVVQLIETYTSAVPVCSLEMDLGTTMDPAVIRIQNIGTSSFEIKLQSAVSAEAVIQMVRDVHCVVVEEGAWQLPDGRLIEAQKLMSTVTANKSNWSAVQSVSYLNSYSSTPVVLGQVISTNDARWSVFMAHGGGDRTTRPTTTELKVGKLTAGDFSERSDEMLGVIVVAAGHAFSGSTEIETARSQNVARGYVEGLRGHLFQQEFGIEPAVMVVSQVGYIGGDGSWAVMQDLPLADHFRPALDEDMFEDAERVHTSETMDYMVLTVAGSLTLTAPVDTPSSPMMEALVVSGLGDSWLVVQLIETYTSAVPVCSLEMDLGTAMDPAVIRIQNIGTSSFEIKLQSAVSAEAVIQMVRDVHCVVVEEGAWQLPDGRLIEAQKLMSTVTANKSNWSAVQSVSYLNSYSSTPVVLGQVISTNDAWWSVFMAYGGGDRLTRPTTTELKVGKLTAGDFSERSDEMLGVIVVAAGHAFSGSTEIETARSQNVATGYVEGLHGHLFQQEFGIEPAVMVVSQVGYMGKDGSWAVIQGLPLADHFRPAVDEDMFEDAERVHTSETMDYIVLSVAGSLPLI